MDIKIFEDQTGIVMFPEIGLYKTSSKNMDVVKLFDNKIDLRIINREDFLEITCYLLVHRGHERAIGCYIVGTGKYTDSTFGNFKNDANSALRNIGFEHHYDDTENAVFDNIEKFDRDGQSHKDIDLIVEAKNSGERVNYKGGDVGEIAVLCRQILKRIGSVDIVLSTVESNLGHVNVARSKMHDERLSPTSQGRQVLDRQIRKAEQRRIEENRKKEAEKRILEEEEKRRREIEIANLEEKRRLEDIEKRKNDAKLADYNIERGIALIEEGLEIKRKAGYNDSYIDNITGIINDVINGKLSDFPHDKVEDNKILEGTFLVKDAITSKRRAGYTDVEISSNTKIKGSCITIRSYIHHDEDKEYHKYDDKKQEDNVVLRVASTKVALPVARVKIVAVIVTLLFIGLLASSWFYGIPFDLNKIIRHEQINKSETISVSVSPAVTTSQVSNVAITTTLPVQTVKQVTSPNNTIVNESPLQEINATISGVKK